MLERLLELGCGTAVLTESVLIRADWEWFILIGMEKNSHILQSIVNSPITVRGIYLRLQ